MFLPHEALEVFAVLYRSERDQQITLISRTYHEPTTNVWHERVCRAHVQYRGEGKSRNLMAGPVFVSIFIQVTKYSSSILRRVVREAVNQSTPFSRRKDVTTVREHRHRADMVYCSVVQCSVVVERIYGGAQCYMSRFYAKN